MKGRLDFYMNYLDIYSLNETTRISAHNVIHHYLCIVSSEKSDSNGYLSKEWLRLRGLTSWLLTRQDWRIMAGMV